MSGGFFDYEDSKLYHWADKIFTEKIVEEKHLSTMMRDFAYVINRYDYWKCGDISKDGFMEAWNKFLGKYNIKFAEDKEGEQK